MSPSVSPSMMAFGPFSYTSSIPTPAGPPPLNSSSGGTSSPQTSSASSLSPSCDLSLRVSTGQQGITSITSNSTPGLSPNVGQVSMDGISNGSRPMMAPTSAPASILMNGPHISSSPSSSLYPSPATSFSADSPYCTSSHIDPAAAFYPSLPGYGFKDATAAASWANIAVAQSAAGYYYDTPFSPYGYPPGYDFNGSTRRKNVTRDSTATLKAWLNEHRKNPYPTKGEKIMLAIITKMTLTQVSTWFANARRRLKKENKMTWEPRNRCEDNDDGSNGAVSSDNDDEIDPRSPSDVQPDDGQSKRSISPSNVSNEKGSTSDGFIFKANCATQSLDKTANNNNNNSIKKEPLDPDSSLGAPSSKPKIWSLADTAIGDKPKSPSSESPVTSVNQSTGPSYQWFRSSVSSSSYSSFSPFHHHHHHYGTKY